MIPAALVLATLWLAAGLLAWRQQRVAGVTALLLGAAPLFVIAVVPLARAVFDREAYVRQLGQAALADLPSTAAICTLSLLAIVAALVSLRGSGRWFAVAWLALAPIVAFTLYLAFAFRIF